MNARLLEREHRNVENLFEDPVRTVRIEAINPRKRHR